MNNTGKQSFFKASLLAALLATSWGVNAAGLGKMTVYSAIGQPLNAEVAITASSEELSALTARLASNEAFKNAGIDFMPALTGLRFSVLKVPNGQPVLKLYTDRPLNEPFLHFLVELNWTSGRMVREYTFLLDPPEMLQVAKSASVVAPPVTPAIPPAVKPVPATEAKPVPTHVVKEAPLPAPAQAAEAETRQRSETAGVKLAEREVKRGETLSKIAREIKSDTVSLDQMLVALFNSNRDAFSGENMNRLRAGKILRIPEVTAATALDSVQARKLVVSQAADFNAYKRRLAEVAGTAPAATAEPSQQASGRITPRVEDKAPAATATDKLQVSRTETSKAGKAGDASRKNLEEDLIARDKSLREASERIAELEKNLDNLKKLVELKSQSGVQMQQKAQAAVIAAKPAEEKQPVPAKPVAEPVPVKPAAKATPPTPAPATPAAALETPKPAAVMKPLPPPPPPPEPDFLDLEENPEILYGAGGIVALLLMYLGYARFRKGKLGSQQPVTDQPSVSESQVASRSGAVFGAASESVDNGEVSIQGDFSENGVLTTEESVDPVAEADVLMAYGRDGQAEEILLEGLKTDPSRGAIHLKLLELYANRKNTSRFEAVAQQLRGLSGGQGTEWDKAVTMARGLGVSGGLFARETPASESADEFVAPIAVATEPNRDERAAETVIMNAVQPLPDEASSGMEDLDGSLDFDLDLGTTSGPAIAAAAEQAAAKTAVEEAVSLDFDFDLGASEPAVAPAALPVTEVAAPTSADSNAIDFSLDIGSIDAVPAVDLAEEAQYGASTDIDFDIDFDAPSVLDVAAPVSMAEPEPQVPAVDAADIEFDLDLGAVSAPELAVAPAEPLVAAHEISAPLDLSAISLELEEPAEPLTSSMPDLPLGELSLPEVELPAPESFSATADDFDLALDIGEPEPEADSALIPVEFDNTAGLTLPETGTSLASDLMADVEDNPEVATKLELAQAYEEMGDLEGAKELLNEVLNEGSPAQLATAQARLAQLSL